MMTTSQDGSLFARSWDVPWHAHVLPLALVATLFALWLNFSVSGQMPAWALSWSALQQGRIGLPVLHIFAHGGLAHVLMNSLALLFLSGPLISRLGSPPLSWARFLYVFIGSGVSGGAVFLMTQHDAASSALGASGSIFGIAGALTRVHPATGEVVAVRSARTWLLAKFFVLNHLALFGIVLVTALITGVVQGLAWEAHLGGLLFGFLATPLYLPSRRL